MSLRLLIAGRKAFLVLLVCLLVSVEVIGLACELPFSALAVIACLFVVGALAALAWDWKESGRYYAQLGCVADELEHAHQLQALVDEPRRADLEANYLALESLSQVAMKDVADAQDACLEYRNYVETWVHEVKTPLAAAKLLLGREASAATADAEREIDRALFYVDQALWYARSTNVGADYLIRKVDLAKAVSKACRQNARFLIERKAVPHIESMEGITVLTDEKWLVFMLVQALTNAAQYGARNLVFSVRREPGESGTENVVLELADDGQGIPPEDLPRVFDQGFTGFHGRQSRSSAGMGLFLCARMAQKLGLGLSIASEEGSHTRFMLTFPGDQRIVSYGSLRSVPDSEL